MDLLFQVKCALGITGDDMDLYLNSKILAVKSYLTNAGASEKSITSDLGVSCIAIGVNDLLNQDSGAVKFSPAFTFLANQVCRM